MTDIEEDQANINRLAGDLTRLARRATAKFAGPDGRSSSLHRITVKFTSDGKHPPFDLSPSKFGYSLFDLGTDALEAGEEVMNYLCGLHELDPGLPGTDLPVAVFAIDFKGSSEGWPLATEMPLINAFIIVPRPHHDDFEQRQLFAEALKFQCHSRVGSIRKLEVQEIELSDLGVAMAARHVLSFARTLPSKLFPAEANSIRFVNYPEE